MAAKNWNDDFMSQLIDEQAWKELSQDFQWSEQLLEKYADKVDWHELSDNSGLVLSYELLDKFIERWDWSEIIGCWDDGLFDEDFLERYKEYIPASVLQHSRLWDKIVEKRKTQLANQITAAV